MKTKLLPITLSLLSLLFSSCGNETNSGINVDDFIDKRTGEIIHKYSIDVPTIAHRGFHLLDPDNTEKSFIAASKRYFIGIETDIHWSKDGHIIVNHDDYLKGMDKPIKESNYIDLATHNIGEASSPVFICEFSTYLSICKQSKKAPVIEIKSSPTLSQCIDLIEIVNHIYKDDNGINNCIFISFDINPIKQMRDLKISNNYTYDVFLLGSSKEDADKAISENVNASILHSTITEELANKMHDNNLKLATWTVNDINDVDRLIKLGVTTITSDYIECDPKYCN